MLQNFQNSWFRELGVKPRIWVKEVAVNTTDFTGSSHTATPAPSDPDQSSQHYALEELPAPPSRLSLRHIHLQLRDAQPVIHLRQTDIREFFPVVKKHRFFPIRRMDIRRYFTVARKARWKLSIEEIVPDSEAEDN
jgi:hypothetical protein